MYFADRRKCAWTDVLFSLIIMWRVWRLPPYPLPLYICTTNVYHRPSTGTRIPDLRVHINCAASRCPFLSPLPQPPPQVAAGSVVLRDLPPRTTAAGVPAKVIGVATEGRPSETVDQNLEYVLYSKGSNGSGTGSKSLESSVSRADGVGVGARRDAAPAPRKGSNGVRGIEEKTRSFL